MRDLPTVTVVLPTYNSERFIAAQLASIQAQTYPDIRLKVRDDRSQDATLTVIRDLTSGDPRVEVMRNNRNVGQRETLYHLLRSVDSPLFALADHDDIWLPDKVERSVAALLQSSADLIYTDFSVVGEDLQVKSTSGLMEAGAAPVIGRRPIAVLVRNPVYGCTTVGRTSMLPTALPHIRSLPSHDRWLALVASVGNGLCFLDERTTLYRQHGGNFVGLTKSSVTGVAANVVRFGGGNLSRYLRQRLQGRNDYVSRLTSLTHDDDLLFLQRFYSASRPTRMTLATEYARVMKRSAGEVGAKARVFDLLASTLAGGSNSNS